MKIDLGKAGAADQPLPADARPAHDADRRQQQIREPRRTTGCAPESARAAASGRWTRVRAMDTKIKPNPTELKERRL